MTHGQKVLSPCSPEDSDEDCWAHEEESCALRLEEGRPLQTFVWKNCIYDKLPSVQFCLKLSDFTISYFLRVLWEFQVFILTVFFEKAGLDVVKHLFLFPQKCLFIAWFCNDGIQVHQLIKETNISIFFILLPILLCKRGHLRKVQWRSIHRVIIWVCCKVSAYTIKANRVIPNWGMQFKTFSIKGAPHFKCFYWWPKIRGNKIQQRNNGLDE